MNYLNYLAPLISFAVCFALLYGFLRSPMAQRVLDQPNHRSLHAAPVPRVGGIAIFLAIVLAWLISEPPGNPIWIAACLLVLISLADDLKGVSFIGRLLVHFIAVCIFINSIATGWLLGAFLIVASVWMINLYNFMDGSDGLAGGMAIFGFTAYGVAALLAGANNFAIVNFVVAGANAAFLILNFHPARIFMGDTGSILLGFLAAAFAIQGWEQEVWPYWFPVLVFSPFILDATITLAKRFRRKEKIWQAHKEHYYQKLVQMGWGHRKTALAEYALMLAVCVSAVLTVQLKMSYLLVIIAWSLIYSGIILAIEHDWKIFLETKNSDERKN